MLRLLLDTNVVIWARRNGRELSDAAREAIVDADNAVAVSAASVWEISIKAHLGKLERPPVDDVVEDLRERYSLVEITAEHAWAAGQLPLHHRDPFDRLLVAQAQLDGYTIVTRDPKISRYQVAVLAA